MISGFHRATVVRRHISVSCSTGKLVPLFFQGERKVDRNMSRLDRIGNRFPTSRYSTSFPTSWRNTMADRTGQNSMDSRPIRSGKSMKSTTTFSRWCARRIRRDGGGVGIHRGISETLGRFPMGSVSLRPRRVRGIWRLVSRANLVVEGMIRAMGQYQSNIYALFEDCMITL